MKKVIYIVAILSLLFSCGKEKSVNKSETDKKLLEVLGEFPEKPKLSIDTLETAEFNNGWRYKIKYLAEDSIPSLGIPQDWVFAYLFVPKTEYRKKLPGIVAIHQDDIACHIGKSEPAGIDGDSTMFYGLDLFNQGYVVICPDRFYHGERRLLSKMHPWKRKKNINPERDFRLLDYQVGVLFLQGRTLYSKQAYDVSRAVDVLTSLSLVDEENIGIIGHSAGGNVVPYAMFFDKRIKLGVSSCGVFDVAQIFKMNVRQPFPSCMAIPALVKNNLTTADYLKSIYPRSLLLTRGKHEWGKGDIGSITMIEELRRFEKTYNSNGDKGDIKTIVFEENGGEHAFPKNVKKDVYKWIDQRLK
ncbi:prolyl oligopeptidase family serine peptidase [Ancylomarina sp. DW003]|nr:prolyl oligopeptidase family serine peptidase [Ancylomarina sp. DW003]MDE5422380.1 prolyl oligopeptidase family serine peptidase [Ancylomarina sp. DW003]